MRYNFKDNVTRKAILIGSPGPSNNYLKGVKYDLLNWKDFLKSERGGAFYESEIITLNNPSYKEVAFAIKKYHADYLTVYFSGHGYTGNDDKRMLCLKDENVPDTFLLNESPRQLVVVDACRNNLPPGIYGVPPEYGEAFSNFYGSPARELFDGFIQSSPMGKIIIHATQTGQSSYDTLYGGAFTKALLNVQVAAKTDYTSASIKKIIKHISPALAKKHNPQTPCIAYEEGNMTIPFAIGVPFIDKPIELPKKPILVQRPSNTNWLALGLLAVAVVAIVAAD